MRKEFRLLSSWKKIRTGRAGQRRFLSQGKRKGYNKCLVGNGSMIGVDKIAMQWEYDEAQECNAYLRPQ